MTKTIKRAVVIGGTGLVGHALLKQLSLVSTCEHILAVVRKQDSTLQHIDKVEQLVIEDFLLLNDHDVSGFSHAFSCLGTTIKKAGSKANFYNIDFEINAHFADLFEGTETHYVLVSAQGANPGSPFFYNQVKGELESHLKNSNLAYISILQPSLLLGERQEVRTLEDATQKLYQRFSHLVPNSFKYKPVTAEQVAHTMVLVAQSQTEKIKFYDNLYIQNAQ